MDAVIVNQIIAMGFPVTKATLIHALVGGSALHGVKVEGRDDLDVYGIFVERPGHILGLDRFEHFVTSTSPESRRNTAADVDVICYSLRKWARLAAKGNPTVLQLLFTPAGPDDIWWSSVLGNRDKFLARSHARQYMGYADAQLKRMMGMKGRGKHGQRSELEMEFGYDTKAAMHVLRLLREGIQLMREGWILLPRPTDERSWLLDVRRGAWSEERVIREANQLFAELKQATLTSRLPEVVARDEVSAFIAETYLGVWERERESSGGEGISQP